MNTKFEHCAFLGPTGSGKSQLAMLAAQSIHGEIISCDSVQVYRDFDIGSAKPTQFELNLIPHHMIDIVDGKDTFDAGRYAKKTRQILEKLSAQNKAGIIVGGTGLYFRALIGVDFHADLPSDARLREKLEKRSNAKLGKLLRRLDAQRFAKIHPNDRFRLIRALELRVLTRKPLATIYSTESIPSEHPPRIFTVLVNPPADELRQFIGKRVDRMIQAGLIEEVQGLLAKGIDTQLKPMQSIGYKQVVDFLSGKIKIDELREKIIVATCQYAKRQRTWFKKTMINLDISGVSDWPKVEAALRENLRTK